MGLAQWALGPGARSPSNSGCRPVGMARSFSIAGRRISQGEPVYVIAYIREVVGVWNPKVPEDRIYTLEIQ